MLNDPPTVEASNNKANAKRDKIPMILAMVKAALLSFGKNRETRMKMLNAENNIGHILKPNTLIPYRQAVIVVTDNNNFRIEVIRFDLSDFQWLKRCLSAARLFASAELAWH